MNSMRRLKFSIAKNKCYRWDCRRIRKCVPNLSTQDTQQYLPHISRDNTSFDGRSQSVLFCWNVSTSFLFCCVLYLFTFIWCHASTYSIPYRRIGKKIPRVLLSIFNDNKKKLNSNKLKSAAWTVQQYFLCRHLISPLFTTMND